jgi:Protein of unknown function (DUF742)
MSGPGATDPRQRRWDSDSSTRLPDPRMIPRPHEPEVRDDPPVDRPVDIAEPTDSEIVVRPFLMTGGRTRPVRDGLRTHTLVTSPASAVHAPLRFELRQIVQMCQRPTSVAEIAAGIGVPLGVARVLIADLMSSGYAFSHEQDEEALSVETIERIVRRVRAL